MGLPIVNKLVKKNARLRREIKALKSLIYSLPEFRCQCKPIVNTVDADRVVIKQEPIPMQCEPLTENDDEVVFIPERTDKINIVYEIDDSTPIVEIKVETDPVVKEAEVEEEDEVVVKEEEVEEEEEEEEVEEEEVVVKDEEVEEEEEEEDDEVEEEEEEEEEEVIVITISGKSYYTSDKENGKIYAIDKDEEVGDEIGVFVNGKAKFHKK